MSKIEEAKKVVAKWKSLVFVAEKLGFLLTDNYSDEYYEYILIPEKHAKSIEVIISLDEYNNWEKSYPIWYLEDIDGVVDTLAGIAMANELSLQKNDNDKYSLATIEKWSSRELPKER